MNVKRIVSGQRPRTEPDRPRFPGRTVLSVSEVARHLAVTNVHVIALIDLGLLPAINVGLRHRRFWRIRVDNFEAFLDRQDL